MPELRGTPGFRGASLSRRQVGETVEFLVLTRWGSLEAVRGSAGDGIGKTVVEPGAVAALADFDATVRHSDVIEDTAPER
jgi:hypothetical protein